MAAAAIPPGWNASGKKIIDPVAFLESVITPMIKESEKEDELTPIYENTDPTYTGGLVIEFPESLYQYQTIPSFDLTRVAANGDGNCWFDSFLFCISPLYRKLSALDRIPVTIAFRTWCADHADQIFSSIPSTIIEFLEPKDSFRNDMKAIGTEIDLLEGIMIAWFFGVNCIYFATPGQYPNKRNSDKYEPVCESMFQSPNCKVVCMIWSGNHFEPLIHATFTGESLNESSSKTLFAWNDAKLCKGISAAIQSCGGNEVGMMATQPWKVTCAAAGGSYRRGSRSAYHIRSAYRSKKTRRIKRRRSTRRKTYK